MSAVVIDGKVLAGEVRLRLKSESIEIAATLGRKPCLAVVLVGDNSASKVYVANKSKAARKCEIDTIDICLSADISDDALQSKLKDLSSDLAIDGVLLQLPLPKSLDEFPALMSIVPEKDVDGLHPLNQGFLLRHAPAPVPCTPKGVVELVMRARRQLGEPEDLSGLHAVIVGRSVLVGKPLGILLLAQNCTVTYCHSRTVNLKSICKQADILVGAVGCPLMITPEYVKPDAIVIDVGINRTEQGTIVGDVDYDAVLQIAGAITPVPGGVGPMTIAMLLSNTVQAAKSKC